MRSLFILALALALAGCTSQRFTSDVPGFTAAVAPQVIAGSVACTGYDTIEASYGQRTTDSGFTRTSVAYSCE